MTLFLIYVSLGIVFSFIEITNNKKIRSTKGLCYAAFFILIFWPFPIFVGIAQGLISIYKGEE